MTILAQMPLVEVLSLSINNINTLECFAGCSKLRELYLRRNGVATLDELGWLGSLENLRVRVIQSILSAKQFEFLGCIFTSNFHCLLSTVACI